MHILLRDSANVWFRSRALL